MENFLKSLFRKGQDGLSAAAGGVMDFFNQEDDEQNRKETLPEKTGRKVGEFFAPQPINQGIRTRDVIRETPEAVAEVVGRPIMRSFAALGQKLGTGDIRSEYVAETPFEKSMFGEAPVSFTSIGKETRMAAPDAKTIPFLDPLLGGVIAAADAPTGGRASQTIKGTAKAYEGAAKYTTKVLEALKGKTAVSRQFIEDLLKKPDIKQSERALVTKVLNATPDTGKVDVASFAEAVEDEVLPLTINGVQKTNIGTITEPRYESIALPEEQRGNIAIYQEKIYESPVTTSAGSVHFGGSTKNYFGHSRIEDMPSKNMDFKIGPAEGTRGMAVMVRDPQDQGSLRIIAQGFDTEADAQKYIDALPEGGTRRVIELQSDLFQRGRLTDEIIGAETDSIKGAITRESEIAYDKRISDLGKLEPYKNTWWERMVREEVKDAAAAGKTRLLFPTGETAMKVEGLANTQDFRQWTDTKTGQDIMENSDGTWDIEPGQILGNQATGQEWLVVTADRNAGNMRGIQMENFVQLADDMEIDVEDMLKAVDEGDQETIQNIDGFLEAFNLSGKIDVNNPIFKFYESQVAKYLKRKYGATRFTDENGVTWVQVDVKPQMAKAPVEAFGVAAGIQTDEEGNVEFDPLSALLGIGAVGATRAIKGAAGGKPGKMTPKIMKALQEFFKTSEIKNGSPVKAIIESKDSFRVTFENGKNPVLLNKTWAKTNLGVTSADQLEEIYKTTKSFKTVGDILKKTPTPKVANESTLLDRAYALSKDDFIKTFQVEPTTAQIKDKTFSLTDFEPAGTKNQPTGRIGLQDAEPYEYNSFEDVLKETNGREYVDQMVKFLKANPKKDLPPVLLSGRVGDAQKPFVVDGMHRMQAYRQAGRKDIPYWYDNNTLEDIWQAGQGTGRNIPPSAADTVNGMLRPKKNERRFITRTRAMEPNLDPKLQGSLTTRSTDELSARADEIIAADMNKAINLAKTGTDDTAVAVASRLIDRFVTEAKAAKSEAAKDAIWERVADIANDAAKNLTENGRAIQAATLLGRTTPEGMVRFAAKTIQNHNTAVQKSQNPLERTLGGMVGTRAGKALKEVPELTPSQASDIVKKMEDIERTADPLEKAKKMQKLTDEIQAYLPSSLYQKIATVWKAGLLTGLKTTGLNISSNTAHFLSEIIKDVPASMVDRLASLVTGKRTLAMTTGGTSKGLAEGAKKGWTYWKTGFDERDIGSKLDYKKVNFGNGKIAKAIQAYEELVFRTIGSQDQPFYYATKMRSLSSQAIAQAKNKNLRGAEAKAFVENLMQNPTDDMLKYAVLDAETAVFQNKTTLGKAAKAIQDLPGGQFVLPFAKTPSAVATQIINYSPAGIAKTIIENVGKGKFDQRLFSQGMGRGITGTGAVAIGMALYKNGMLTLGFPSSEKEREQWELEGKLPNSIYIDGQWRNVGVLGPAGLLTIIGGHFQDGLEETGSLVGGLVRSVAGFGTTLTEQSFLKGVNGAIEAIQDPARSFQGFASSLAGSIVPTIIGDIARATDDYERQAATPGQRIQSRVPGLRDNLQPKVDTLGNKIDTQGFWTVMMDPTRPGNASALPEDKPIVDELRRLSDAGFPTTPTQLGPNAGYESLTPEENTYLWRVAGLAAKDAIKSSMQGRTYGRLDDEEKSKLISDRIDEVKVEARARTILKATANMQGEQLKQRLAKMKEDGLLTKQVFEKYQSLKRRENK